MARSSSLSTVRKSRACLQYLYCTLTVMLLEQFSFRLDRRRHKKVGAVREPLGKSLQFSAMFTSKFASLLRA